MRALMHVQWWEANFIKRTANKVPDLLSKMELPTPIVFPSFLPPGAHEQFLLALCNIGNEASEGGDG